MNVICDRDMCNRDTWFWQWFRPEGRYNCVVLYALHIIQNWSCCTRITHFFLYQKYLVCIFMTLISKKFVGIYFHRVQWPSNVLRLCQMDNDMLWSQTRSSTILDGFPRFTEPVKFTFLKIGCQRLCCRVVTEALKTITRMKPVTHINKLVTNSLF